MHFMILINCLNYFGSVGRKYYYFNSLFPGRDHLVKSFHKYNTHLNKEGNENLENY